VFDQIGRRDDSRHIAARTDDRQRPDIVLGECDDNFLEGCVLAHDRHIAVHDIGDSWVSHRVPL
jgi:hypothetical protein